MISIKPSSCCASAVPKAAKKAGRDASEGLIDTYIHLGGKVGVLCEINCESDFVAKTDDFKQFVRDIAMHIAAASPVCVSREEIDPALLEAERKVAKGQAEGKPAQAVEKIVEASRTNTSVRTACSSKPMSRTSTKPSSKC